MLKIHETQLGATTETSRKNIPTERGKKATKITNNKRNTAFRC
jgi:hypothetical protein